MAARFASWRPSCVGSCRSVCTRARRSCAGPSGAGRPLTGPDYYATGAGAEGGRQSGRMCAPWLAHLLRRAGWAAGQAGAL